MQRDSQGQLTVRNYVRKTAVSNINALALSPDTAWIFGVSLKGRTKGSGYNIRTENVASPVSAALPLFKIFLDASGVVERSGGVVDRNFQPSCQG